MYIDGSVLQWIVHFETLCNRIHSIQFCLLRWGKLIRVWDMGVKVRLDHMLVADARKKVFIAGKKAHGEKNG